MRGITAGYGYRPIPSCSLSFLIGEQNKKKKNYFVSGSLIMVKPCWTNLIPTMNRKQTALGESRNAGVAAKYSGLDGSRCNPRAWVSPEANCGPRQSTVTVDSQVSTGIIQKPKETKRSFFFFPLVLTQIPPSYPSLSSWKGLSLFKKIVSFAARKEMLSKL